MATPGAKKKWLSGQDCGNAAGSCNLYCVYCHNPPAGQQLDPAVTAAELKRRGVTAVSLEGGGEPTAGPHFFAWLKASKKDPRAIVPERF